MFFDQKIALWDLATGRLRAEAVNAERVSALAVAPTGLRFATGDVAGTVTIWDAAAAAPIATCQPHTAAIRAIEFAPDGGTAVSGGNDGEVRICDVSSGADRLAVRDRGRRGHGDDLGRSDGNAHRDMPTAYRRDPGDRVAPRW